jgi:hypothetical protein
MRDHLEDAQERLAERLTGLADKASLDHCEYVLSQPPGHWNEAKSNTSRTVINSLIRIDGIVSKDQQTTTEGTTYDQAPTRLNGSTITSAPCYTKSSKASHSLHSKKTWKTYSQSSPMT